MYSYNHEVRDDGVDGHGGNKEYVCCL